jgi:hypothetical protein
VIAFAIVCYWGYYFLCYVQISVLAGAVGRHCLSEGLDGSEYLDAFYSTIFVLIGPIIFGSLIISMCEVFIQLVKPREKGEKSPLSSIPFFGPAFDGLSQVYTYAMENYFVWVLDVLKYLIEYVTEYSIVISTIYGDTLCASAMEMFDMNLLDVFINDAIVMFVVQIIANMAALFNCMLMYYVIKYGIEQEGYLNITPAPQDKISEAMAASMYVISYVINTTFFNSLHVFARATLVCHSFEEEKFDNHAHPEMHSKVAAAKIRSKSAVVYTN